MAYNLSELTTYVQENRDVIIRNAVLGNGGIRNRMSIQTGIKTKEKLHPFEVNPIFQNGRGCGFSAQGEAKISERELETGIIKVNMEFCPDDLLGKYAEYLVKISATANELPFEQYIIDGVVAAINEGIEKMMFLGDKASEDHVLKHIDGLVKILKAEEDVTDVAIAAGQTAYQGILSVYMAMPEEVINKGAEILVSPAIFRAFMQDMVKANLYHYNPNEGTVDSFILPGTDVVVRKEVGLTGSLNVIGTYPKNLYYGTDLENATEDVKVWFSDDDDNYKLKVKWNSGVQVAFPQDVVLGEFAQQPK
jgi:hypothetical protein